MLRFFRSPSSLPRPVDAALAKALEQLAPDTVSKAASAHRARSDYAEVFLAGRIKLVLEWLAGSNEQSNFTYPISPSNIRQLSWFVASVTGKPQAEAKAVIAEIVGDAELRDYYRTQRLTARYEDISDATLHWGRRLGWYAFVRLLKPKLVVETGVHLGVGALAITSALLRNRDEGHEGCYVGLEISNRFGKLLGGRYAEAGEVRYGPSLASIEKLEGPVDLFIHDSDHRYEHELAEFRAVSPLLSPRALLLSDNAHATDALIDFAEQTGRQFLYFQESPRKHFYVGSGIGAAWDGAARLAGAASTSRPAR